MTGDPAVIADIAEKIAEKPLTLGTFIRPPATPGAVGRSRVGVYNGLVLLGGTLLAPGDVLDGVLALEPVPRETASGGISVDADDVQAWLDAARAAPEVTVLYQYFAPVRRARVALFPAGPCTWTSRIDSDSVTLMVVSAAWDAAGAPITCADARARLGL